MAYKQGALNKKAKILTDSLLKSIQDDAEASEVLQLVATYKLIERLLFRSVQLDEIKYSSILREASLRIGYPDEKSFSS